MLSLYRIEESIEDLPLNTDVLSSVPELPSRKRVETRTADGIQGFEDSFAILDILTSRLCILDQVFSGGTSLVNETHKNVI